jgi:hypothetical protein
MRAFDHTRFLVQKSEAKKAERDKRIVIRTPYSDKLLE